MIDYRVAENHWRSIHAAKAEKAAEERERKRREVKERIKEIEVRYRDTQYSCLKRGGVCYIVHTYIGKNLAA